jgi:hypothetical protein
MSFWTTTKTALALVSIGILITPVLRRLGYLPPEDQPSPPDAEAEGGPLAEAGNGGAPVNLSSLPDNGNGEYEQRSSRH